MGTPRGHPNRGARGAAGGDASGKERLGQPDFPVKAGPTRT